MISSAVVIPDQEFEQRSSSPTLKRRQSSVSSDSNKRPRLDTQISAENGPQPNSAGAMSPPSRRRSALGVGAAEEKKRGQRLFGALLGTLSQKSSKPAHRKRDEIEQRQRERARKDTEEKEEEQRRKRKELDRVRRVEQKAWEKESMRIRHRNMRAMAGFLQTKTEPKLYYKPWELREDEAEQIKRQIQAVEEEIKDELRNHEGDDDKPVRDDNEGVHQDKVENTHRSQRDDAERSNEKSPEDEDMGDAQNGQHEEDEESASKPDTSHSDDARPAEQKPNSDDRPKEDENAGEELVEGQEDDVIY